MHHLLVFCCVERREVSFLAQGLLGVANGFLLAIQNLGDPRAFLSNKNFLSLLFVPKEKAKVFFLALEFSVSQTAFHCFK